MIRSTSVRALAHVGHELGGRSARAILDVAAALLETAWILVAQLAQRRALQPPHHAVGVAGDVGQHDGPTLQPGRRLGRRATSSLRSAMSASSAAWAATHPSIKTVGTPCLLAGHEGGMVDCPSSMSAMTARMNSSASSVMPPATPP